MTNKVLAFLLIIIMIFCLPLNSYALIEDEFPTLANYVNSVGSVAEDGNPYSGNGVVGDDISQGKISKYDFAAQQESDGTYSADNLLEIYGTQASTFFLKIPKSIIIGSNKTCNFSVGVKGNLSGEQIVTIIPESSFNLHEVIPGTNTVVATAIAKNNVAASVVFTDENWTHYDDFESDNTNYVYHNGTITAPVSAGSWQGTFSFDVNLALSNEIPIIRDGYFKTNQAGDLFIENNVSLPSKFIINSKNVVYTYNKTNQDTSRMTATGIGASAFANHTEIEEIIIPASITTIDVCAFENCTNLKKVIFLSDTTLIIRTSAFAGCTALTDIEFSNDLTKITLNPTILKDCTSLTSVVFPTNAIINGLYNNAFQNCTSLQRVVFPNETPITNVYACFSGCTSLREVYIPAKQGDRNATITIRAGCFTNCPSLTGVYCRSTSVVATGAFSGTTTFTESQIVTGYTS